MNGFQIDNELLRQWRRLALIHFPALCQPRSAHSHKGTFGTLGIVGGAEGMAGSITLAGMAALHCGCGKVWLGFHQSALPIPLLFQQPEIMLSTANRLLQRSDITAWVIGCGLGTETSALTKLTECLQQKSVVPMLLDADALNLVAQQPALLSSRQNQQDIILTPHLGEAARLLHCTIGEIQNNHYQAVRCLAEKYDAWVVLKGHQSLIASPNGQVQQNETGNSGLATAGSGDVLAGIIGSLLAQRIPPQQAVYAGVWLHGAAADILAASEIGPIGLCASEIAAAVRWLRNRLTEPV
ncbi:MULTISPECIES: NAD(P)H-hydrate dehydratase [Snodgrassella]|uniref:NAD(P)H-hydrate dehydratase n=1 Tax=Snodgrassella TaxID=1193515 RepID=UPI000815627D|nr:MULTISPECIES: NAD(P)H-hydrate dehydratase [Snodgrassella]SCB79180.1 yjeF C-terminal region, hydroxyethylthiazole kinase-related [Snodgrassella sp. R-53583]